MLKINVWNRVLCLISLALGAVASGLIGLLTYRQAAANLDSRTSLQAVQRQVESLPPSSDIRGIRAVDTAISPYNRSVLNARLLMRISDADLSELEDAELLKLKDTYREKAARLLAVREYGVVLSAAVGVFSIFLTAASAWVVLCGLWYAFDRLLGRRRTLSF